LLGATTTTPAAAAKEDEQDKEVVGLHAIISGAPCSN
jgi:hypothetical protein